mmetsp:Transcript_16728/g.26058  ORF Transcript_16728/g.26058 Transcript_16728/m.26058 type:complete len:236 (-) Transcript_16728:414-1121(-)
MKLCSSLAFILVPVRMSVLGFSPIRWKVDELIIHQPLATLRGDTKMDRSSFLDKATSLIIGATIPSSTTIAVATVSSLPNPANAIEFVPASPFFSGTYQDAVEIMYAQRIAVDNIANVIQDGNMEEAGFKVMQLNAQTRAAGKIILDSYQQQLSRKDDNLMLLRFLSCQKKFAVLLDSCDECGEALQKTLKGKLGATAAAQIKSSKIVDETKSAYDDFLLDVKTMEKELDFLRGM